MTFLMHSLNRLLILIMGAAVLCGCGGNVSVTGKVFYEDDQTPLTSGIINFESDTFQARSGIRSDGSYRMGSAKEGDGVPPGKYRVVIMAYQQQERT